MSRHLRDLGRTVAEQPKRAPEAPQIAYEPALPERRSAAPAAPPRRRSALARGYGNQAVSRILARDPNPALEAVKKVGHKTGAEVDAALDASPFFKPLIADGVKAGKKADGHVHIHDAATFLTKCART